MCVHRESVHVVNRTGFCIFIYDGYLTIVLAVAVGSNPVMHLKQCKERDWEITK